MFAEEELLHLDAEGGASLCIEVIERVLLDKVGLNRAVHEHREQVLALDVGQTPLVLEQVISSALSFQRILHEVHLRLGHRL